MLISVPDRRRHRIVFSNWHQSFSLHTPLQEFHSLTEPPAGGTEAEFMHGATSVLHGPVNRRLHRSPHKSEGWSHDANASYTTVGMRCDNGNGRSCWKSAGQYTLWTTRDDGQSRALETIERRIGLIDVVGPITARISRKHALVQLPRFHQLLSLKHHCCSSEGAGGSERLGIDRRTERLALHVMSPCPHPRRRFRSRRHHTLKLVNEQDQLRGIGSDETLLIPLPQRHDGWRNLCRMPLKQRHALATTEKDSEQTDDPTHGHLSVTCDCSYSAWGEKNREEGY